MAFLTDRKRASGMGSAKTGTEHHWMMTMTSIALIPLVIAFIYTFGAVLGRPYEEVIAYYQRPFPAIVALLTFAVGFYHFRGGVQTLIEDYVPPKRRKSIMIGAICLSYAAGALGVFAVLRLAL